MEGPVLAGLEDVLRHGSTPCLCRRWEGVGWSVSGDQDRSIPTALGEYVYLHDPVRSVERECTVLCCRVVSGEQGQPGRCVSCLLHLSTQAH